MTSKPPFGGEVVRLGELIESSKAKNKDGLFADVYSVTNSHGFVPSQEYFNKEVYSKELRTYRVVHRNMIAYNPSRINVGSVAVQDKVDNAIVSPLYVVFSADETKVIPGYLVRFLRSKPGLDQIAQQSIGTVRSNLKFDALCKMQMPLPSLQAQVERMNKLTLVEQLADDCEHYLFHLDELVKSRFVEMFGGSSLATRTIGELATDIRYGTSKKSSDEGRYTYLRMNNMTDDGRLDFADTKRITLDGSELDKCLVHKGDLLFNRTNSREKVGKTAVFEEDEPMVIAGYIIRVRLVPDIRSRYLCAYMNLPHVKEQLRAMAKGAVHQANINAKQLGTIQVPVPRISQQDEFISFVSRVDKLRVEAQVQKEKLQTLYDSLAQDYFAI
ncbi:restriction endonuclease subunit S [Parafannyhessea umbonata]|uniref:restriction endonuclease subunit S n=1 Tax=Parafannyhessea umbonata TaxID=604330 RepID=UPI003F9C3BA0